MSYKEFFSRLGWFISNMSKAHYIETLKKEIKDADKQADDFCKNSIKEKKDKAAAIKERNLAFESRDLAIEMLKKEKEKFAAYKKKMKEVK